MLRVQCNSARRPGSKGKENSSPKYRSWTTPLVNSYFADNGYKGKTLHHGLSRCNIKYLHSKLTHSQAQDLKGALGWRDLGWNGTQEKLSINYRGRTEQLTLLQFLLVFSPNLTPTQSGINWQSVHRKKDPGKDIDPNMMLVKEFTPKSKARKTGKKHFSTKKVLTPRSSHMSNVATLLRSRHKRGGNFSSSTYSRIRDELVSAKIKHFKILGLEDREKEELWFLKLHDRKNFKRVNDGRVFFGADSFSDSGVFKLLKSKALLNMHGYLNMDKLKHHGIADKSNNVIKTAFKVKEKEAIRNNLSLNSQEFETLFNTNCLNTLRDSQQYIKIPVSEYDTPKQAESTKVKRPVKSRQATTNYFQMLDQSDTSSSESDSSDNEYCGHIEKPVAKVSQAVKNRSAASNCLKTLTDMMC